MSLEATWGTDGAHSIHHTRYPEDLAYVKRVCPNRLSTSKKADPRNLMDQTQRPSADALLSNDSVLKIP